ncbi:MAG: hypothetical protein J0L69_02600 [Bacteroidetes bacterium]|nr:hypothetical protein [Bacteroidota bacterium]
MINGTKNAPPANIVIPHFIAGAFSFLVLCLLMALSPESFRLHYFNPNLLAITHLAVLGWASNVILGALYQLLPVLTQSPLYSIKLSRLSFFLFNLGVVILVYSFYNFRVGVIMLVAAALLITAVILVFTNVYLTIKKSDSKEIVLDFISTAIFWLFVTAVIGAFMAVNFVYPFIRTEHLTLLKVHANIGIAGWFILLIFGVASKLLPMFLLSHRVSDNKLKLSYFFINSSLVMFLTDVLVFCTLQRSVIYFSIAALGIISFLTYVYEIYKIRVRRMPDIGMKQSLIAVVFILIPLLMGFIINSNLFKGELVNIKFSMAYLTATIFGVISLLILGQTYKILPFIVWLDKYGSVAGKSKVPLPKDLYSESVAKLHFALFVLAFPLFLTGILFEYTFILQLANILLVIVALLYMYNVLKICYPSASNTLTSISYGRT